MSCKSSETSTHPGPERQFQVLASSISLHVFVVVAYAQQVRLLHGQNLTNMTRNWAEGRKEKNHNGAFESLYTTTLFISTFSFWYDALALISFKFERSYHFSLPIQP